MTPLCIGDITPRFMLPTDRGDVFDLCADNVAGRYIAIAFCPQGIPAARDQLLDFAGSHEALTRAGIHLVVVSPEATDALGEHRLALDLPFPLLADPEQRLFAVCGIGAASAKMPMSVSTLLLRPNQHLLAILQGEHQSAQIMARVRDQRVQQSETGLGFQPPILMVPDVLNRDDCEQLIELYDNVDVPLIDSSELNTVDIEGDLKVTVADYDRLDRIDHYITSDDVKALLGHRLKTRLLPEVKKAFQYTVTGYEALRIGRYQGERGGQAHGHRDNSSPEVAHRRFAVSINLNAEDFDGGELRFPEFGPQQYQPATGAAVVFSCSLLHEALEVTRGCRYVLLLFLNGKT